MISVKSFFGPTSPPNLRRIDDCHPFCCVRTSVRCGSLDRPRADFTSCRELRQVRARMVCGTRRHRARYGPAAAAIARGTGRRSVKDRSCGTGTPSVQGDRAPQPVRSVAAAGTDSWPSPAGRKKSNADAPRCSRRPTRNQDTGGSAPPRPTFGSRSVHRHGPATALPLAHRASNRVYRPVNNPFPPRKH
jgi:hypothetical protein